MAVRQAANVIRSCGLILLAAALCVTGGCTTSDSTTAVPVPTVNEETPSTGDGTTDSVDSSGTVEPESSEQPAKPAKAVATFGAGCFWCVEAVFELLDGVEAVESGYMGGKVPNPTYDEVCAGTTGHAEIVQVHFNPNVVGFDELLEVFWKSHDPTTLNRQGADSGTQYRSAVFFHSEEQRKTAEAYKKKLNEAGAFDDPIVTEVTVASDFYPAEDYHQDYFTLNGRAPYCRGVIQPKIDKVREVFKDKLK